MINKKLFRIGSGLVLTTALAGFAMAQDPTPMPTVSPSPMPTMTPTPMPTPSPMLTPTPTPTPDAMMVARYSPQQERKSVESVSSAPDDKWTVIEYPEGQEVIVELASNQVQGAQGTADVIRTAEDTTINLDVSGLPADAKDYYVYIVDPTGAIGILGQITAENGADQTSLRTPMNKFMLLISPKDNLTSYDDPTAIVFRSKIPDGYAAVSQ